MVLVLSSQAGWPDFYMRTLTEIIAQTIEKLKVDIVAQTLEQLKVDIVAQTLQQLNVNIAGQTQDINVYITGQSENLNVNIAAQTATLDVQVLGTASVSIDAQTVDINVKQSRYTENRIVLENNGTTPSWTSDVAYRVKFFSHRARGIIRKIEIYARNTTSTDENITVELCLSPRGPAIYTFTLTIPAGSSEGWHGILVYAPWGYNQLAVRVRNQGYAEIAYDDGSPYDYYSHSSSVEYIVPGNYRLWVRVYVYATDVGSLPVSGTVNTISIPNRSSRAETGVVSIAAGETKTLIDISATGRTTFIQLSSIGIGIDGVDWYVYCDGEEVLHLNPGFWVTYYADEKAGQGIVLTKRNDTDKIYAFTITVPLEFKYSLRVEAKNSGTTDGHVVARVILSSLI